MVFEVVFLFASLFALGVWLFVREALAGWRQRFRARQVERFLRELEGREVARAEARLGEASEIHRGSGGRRLYVWKGPRSVPEAGQLLIVTLTVDASGTVTNAAWEER